MTIPLDKIQDLMGKAEKATPGPYAFNSKCKVIALSRELPSMQVIAKLENIGASEDGQFFAACSPDLITQLCKSYLELVEARQLLKELDEAYTPNCGVNLSEAARLGLVFIKAHEWLAKHGGK